MVITNLRLSKSGSYVRLWEEGGIVDRIVDRNILHIFIFKAKNTLIMILYVE